jgi:hypothetical protein
VIARAESRQRLSHSHRCAIYVAFLCAIQQLRTDCARAEHRYDGTLGRGSSSYYVARKVTNGCKHACSIDREGKKSTQATKSCRQTGIKLSGQLRNRTNATHPNDVTRDCLSEEFRVPDTLQACLDAMSTSTTACCRVDTRASCELICIIFQLYYRPWFRAWTST